MSNEIRLTWTTGKTLRGMVLNGSCQAYNTSTPGFESVTDAHFGNYGITLTEQGTASGIYCGSMPGGIADGVYDLVVYQCASGTLAVTDTPIRSGTIEMIGGAEARGVWTYLIETGETFLQWSRRIRAALTGIWAPSGSNLLFYRKDGTTVSFTATTAPTGGRNSIVDGTN